MEGTELRVEEKKTAPPKIIIALRVTFILVGSVGGYILANPSHFSKTMLTIAGICCAVSAPMIAFMDRSVSQYYDDKQNSAI